MGRRWEREEEEGRNNGTSLKIGWDPEYSHEWGSEDTARMGNCICLCKCERSVDLSHRPELHWL